MLIGPRGAPAGGPCRGGGAGCWATLTLLMARSAQRAPAIARRLLRSSVLFISFPRLYVLNTTLDHAANRGARLGRIVRKLVLFPHPGDALIRPLPYPKRMQ